ncbi:MAG: hypothetical protein NT126_04375 [Bacteroidetes bacterium]|nr:hypothetical protein [Bacteroidota bacterium]
MKSFTPVSSLPVISFDFKMKFNLKFFLAMKEKPVKAPVPHSSGHLPMAKGKKFTNFTAKF